MLRTNGVLKFLPPGLLVVSLMAVYISTLAPDLTWANYGVDGGDLITAAATGGVAHPTGYPFYLLLARLFQLLPLGSLAYRTNLLSAVAATAAALVVYHLVKRSMADPAGLTARLAALVSAFAFGLSPLLWSQAVITEVYALHALFVALILYLAVLDSSLPAAKRSLDFLIGICVGLGLGNHITIVFLLPVVFWATVFRKPGSTPGRLTFRLDLPALLRRAGGILAVGSLLILSMLLRARLNPPVNWGDPSTLDGLAWLISGKLYAGYFFTLAAASIPARLAALAALLLDQFGVLGLLAALTGLIVFFKRDHLTLSMLWITLLSFVFAVGYSSADAFMYMLPAFLCFSVWIGLGLEGLLYRFPRRWGKFTPWLSLVLMLALFLRVGSTWKDVDASADGRAAAFVQEVITQAPERAVIFAEGDQAVFSLWTAQFALHQRPDMWIIAADLLQFDWYTQTLRDTYPEINLPVDFAFSETVIVNNPDRPVCVVEYDEMILMDCLPARQP